MEESRLPLVIQLEQVHDVHDFITWLAANRALVEDQLMKAGAIHFKGGHVNTLAKFGDLMRFLNPNAPTFLDGNSTRAKHAANVYNASEYDPSLPIYLHTEFSYSNLWPGKIYFCCITPAATGGETTVGDSRRILQALTPLLVEEFDRKSITYIRNLHAGNGLGPSWMEAFETHDKNVLENYCRANGIETLWKKDKSVRFTQTRPAVRTHPITDQRLWFNQVDQFYPLIYGEDVYSTLLMMNGNDEDNLPMYARYGDGSEIQKEAVEEIIHVLKEETIPVVWEQGDLLMVENMLSLHGRLPFTGDRKILASLA